AAFGCAVALIVGLAFLCVAVFTGPRSSRASVSPAQTAGPPPLQTARQQAEPELAPSQEAVEPQSAEPKQTAFIYDDGPAPLLKEPGAFDQEILRIPPGARADVTGKDITQHPRASVRQM